MRLINDEIAMAFDLGKGGGGYESKNELSFHLRPATMDNFRRWNRPLPAVGDRFEALVYDVTERRKFGARPTVKTRLLFAVRKHDGVVLYGEGNLPGIRVVFNI